MADRFDVFLSHVSADKPLVEELARRLTRENLKPWLDKWNLIPGTAWQPEIERIFRVIPVLLPGVERPERSKLPRFLVATTWVEFRATLDDPEAFHRLLAGIRGIPPGMGLRERPDLLEVDPLAGIRGISPGMGPGGGAAFEGRNPYRGLELFDVEHAPLFFGREALTEWLLDALRRKPSGAEDRCLAIIGASGSGKSSLARAGILAALKAGKLEGSATWPLAICRPGPDPFFSLVNAL